MRREYGGGAGGGVLDPPTSQGLPDPSWEDDNAVRCVLCNLDWPLIPALWDWGDADWNMSFAELQEFKDDVVNHRLVCPVCGEPTTFANNLNPLSEDMAWSLKNHADFERYYIATRGRHPDEA